MIGRRGFGWVLAAAFAATVVASALGLHGFSLACWRRYVDGSEPREVLLGKPRDVRSDDWVVALPHALAQRAHAPRFPLRSELVGYGGASTLVGYPVPVRHWAAWFRPQVWGYFVGDDVGLAWHWWVRIFALFAGGSLAFLSFAPSRPGAALLLGAALPLAPFFQFWSFNCEPLAATALLSLAATTRLAVVASPWGIALWGAVLAWSGGAFALSFLYPPYQIPLALLFVTAAGAWIIRERERVRAAGRPAFRALAAGAAALAALVVVGLFAATTWPEIRAMAATIYPGGRHGLGGDLPPRWLLNSFFTPLLGDAAFRAFSNASESGSFLFISPVVLLGSVWLRVVRRERLDPVLVALTGLAACLLLHAFHGLPGVAATATGLSRVAGSRVLPALGLADLLAVAAYLGRERAPDAIGPGVTWSVASAWAAIVLAGGLAARSAAGGGPAVALALPVLACAAIGALTLRRSTLAVVGLAAGAAVLSLWFNPLVRGGAAYVATNPLSIEALRLDREAGGETRWIVYGERPWIANLLRAAGLRVVNGVHFVPQMELWSRLGVVPAGEEFYNRYAHVDFDLPVDGRPRSLHLRSLDGVVVALDPADPAFAALGVDFLVLTGRRPAAMDRIPGLRRVWSLRDLHVFRVGLDSPRAPG